MKHSIRTIFTILCAAALSACGGGNYPPDDPATIHCTIYPADFVGPQKPCVPRA